MATSNMKYSMDTCHQEETGWVLSEHNQCNIFISSYVFTILYLFYNYYYDMVSI